MLNEILEQINSSNGPMTVRKLARRLDVEESALAGMLEFLQRKGRLSVYRPGEHQGCESASCTSCVFAGHCHESDEEAAT
ncbi:MAG: FeoC-like transcriptional regulator [Actinomycetia bacterium]|nr:FeoC-like transcriptional regulator [Actinomycetota bacterium]MCG2796045.1 FeoC-like transcriptional regulator [Actinomycetes bacterium]